MHSFVTTLATFRLRSAARSCLALVAIGSIAAGCAQSSFAATPGQRQLAQGVLTTIAPHFVPEETVSTHDVVEVRANPALQWNPDFLAPTDTLIGMSDKVRFRREIHCLEFSFKPLRMIEVDLPRADGTIEHQLVWYLVYRVRNTGQVLKPVADEDGVYSAQPAKGGPVRFLPQFVLESQDRQAGGERVSKAYLDRVLPAAVAAISQRETPGHMLLNSVQISEQLIPVSDDRIDRGVWGVATWIDVDPRIDFFSVYVGGLTNAYRWEDTPNAFRAGDQPGKGRRFIRKTLQLNFWRPGDELTPNEREFRYGVPLNNFALYGVSDGVAYRWIYR